VWRSNHISVYQGSQAYPQISTVDEAYAINNLGNLGEVSVAYYRGTVCQIVAWVH
jgi:hypothetical protein